MAQYERFSVNEHTVRIGIWLYECRDCGAVVMNTHQHDKWHGHGVPIEVPVTIVTKKQEP